MAGDGKCRPWVVRNETDTDSKGKRLREGQGGRGRNWGRLRAGDDDGDDDDTAGDDDDCDGAAAAADSDDEDDGDDGGDAAAADDQAQVRSGPGFFTVANNTSFCSFWSLFLFLLLFFPSPELFSNLLVDRSLCIASESPARGPGGGSVPSVVTFKASYW